MSKIKKKKSNAGRKPATDPKIPVQFYIETSKVEIVGGIEKAREMCMTMLNNYKPQKQKNEKSIHSEF